MRRSGLWLHIGLALLLLFAQAAAAAHGFVHLTEAGSHSRQPDQQLPHPVVCEQCLVAAALGAGLPAMPLLFVAMLLVSLVVVAHQAAIRPRPVPAYSSRAPPRYV
jgi:hypothetical protein